jgi:nucleoid-associated protein YgaU
MPFRLSSVGAHPIAGVALAGASLMAGAAVGSVFLNTARDSLTAIAAAGPAGPADGILLVVALSGALLSLWLSLGLALSALSALPGALGQACSVLAARIAPAAVRKVVAFILGTAMTAALVPGTATAGTGQVAPRPASAAAAQIVRKGVADVAPDASFRLVSEAVPSWSPEKPAPPAMRASPADSVVVQCRDTLWSIAAQHLGPHATRADIDAEWHRWFAANRDVIGDDANLIAPGQLLSPPAAHQRAS